MKISDIDYVLKRYKLIMDSIDSISGETAVTLDINKRKERFFVNKEWLILLDIIEDVIKSESGLEKHILVECYKHNKTKENVLTKSPMSRNPFYRLLTNKKHKIYCLCACKGLLSYEEILNGM